MIVLGTILLATGPVVADQFRLEVARWHLAAATNAIGQDRRIVEAQVNKASKWVDDLTDLRDYWLFKTQRALAYSPSNVSDVIKEAIAKDKSHVTLGLAFASDQLFQSSNFKDAVEVMEASCIGPIRERREVLNQLAYTRSLAVVELDIALKDINKALEADPDNPMMRDTRAWVLFQMGRPLEALLDANFAIESIGENVDNSPFGGTLSWLEQALIGSPEPRSIEKVLTQKEAGSTLWGIGVLYYHRARILEALGRIDQAEADFQWLRDRRLPTDDRLF